VSVAKSYFRLETKDWSATVAAGRGLPQLKTRSVGGYFTSSKDYTVHMCSTTEKSWFDTRLEQEISCSQKRPPPFWRPPNLLCNGYQGLFPGGERPGREADHHLNLVPRLKIRDIYLHSPCAFMERELHLNITPTNQHDQYMCYWHAPGAWLSLFVSRGLDHKTLFCSFTIVFLPLALYSSTLYSPNLLIYTLLHLTPSPTLRLSHILQLFYLITQAYILQWISKYV
jgi:hypothetical protein